MANLWFSENTDLGGRPARRNDNWFNALGDDPIPCCFDRYTQAVIKNKKAGEVVDICGVCGGDGSSCVADCDAFNSLPLDFQATVCNQCTVQGDDSDMNCECCTSGCTDPYAENYNPSANQDCGNEATWFDGNTF